MRAGSQADAHAALAQLSQGIQRTSRLAQQLLDSARVDASPLREERPVVALPDVMTMVTREFGLPVVDATKDIPTQQQIVREIVQDMLAGS